MIQTAKTKLEGLQHKSLTILEWYNKNPDLKLIKHLWRPEDVRRVGYIAWKLMGETFFKINVIYRSWTPRSKATSVKMWSRLISTSQVQDCGALFVHIRTVMLKLKKPFLKPLPQNCGHFVQDDSNLSCLADCFYIEDVTAGWPWCQIGKWQRKEKSEHKNKAKLKGALWSFYVNNQMLCLPSLFSVRRFVWISEV